MKNTKNKQTAPSSVHLGWLLGLLAILLYANTAGNGFVLDDTLVILKNKFTIQGIKGWSDIFSTDTFFGYNQIKGKETIITGGRYRPLSLAMFAIIYQLVGAKPVVFHILNILMYALTGMLIYKTLQRLLQNDDQEQVLNVPFIAALIYIAHPVHTEVVANIKCADELLSMLLSTLTLWYCIKAYDSGEKRWAWCAGLSFLGACFSKENALTFLAVIPLAIYFFRSPRLKEKSSGIFPVLIPAVFSAVVFFIARGFVLHWKFGDEANVLINNPFIKWDGTKWIPFSFGERSAAIIYSLGEYIRLMVLPHPLTHDYYPRQIGIVTWSDWRVWLSAFAGAGIVFGAWKGVREKHIISFSLLYYIATISIVSNIFFPIGTNLSERFIFMPSLAFAVIFAYILLKFNNKKITLVILCLLCLVYSAKVITRNMIWKDNFTLASTDIAISGNSAKLNNSLAAQLNEKALKSNTPQEKTQFTSQAINYYNKAIEINPNYIEAYYGRGSAFFIRQEYKQALNDYLQAEKIDPQFPNLQNNLVLALRESAKQLLQNPENKVIAVQYLREAQRRFPNDPEVNALLSTYSISQ